MAFLRKLDLFGIKPGLTIENLSKFKSVQGIVITIIAIAITFIAALSPVNNWLYGLNPSIVQETKLNKGSTFIGGIKNPILFGIRCLNIKTMNELDLGDMNIFRSLIPQPKITQIIVRGKEKELIDIFLDRCETKSMGGNLLGYPINSSLYCLTKEIELYDKENGDYSSRLLIQYEREKFNEILYGNPLARCGISIISQNTYLDASDYNNFIQYDILGEELMTKPSPEIIFQTLTFKKQTYKKKLPLFSSSPYDERIYSTLDRSYTRLSIIPPLFVVDMLPIMVITFEFSKKEEIFNLKYLEFQDLLSIIGGTFGLVISSLRVFSEGLNTIPMKAKIMNSIFKFYKEKEFEKDEKKLSNRIEQQNKETVENPEIDKNKGNKTSKEVIINKSKTKIPDRIGTFEIYKITLKSFCKSRLNKREEVIKLIEEFIANSSNLENISKLSYIVTQLSNVVFGSSFAKYVGPPELNLEKENIDFCRESQEVIFRNNVNYQEVDNLDKILDDLTLKENIKNYIVEKYEKSNN